MDTGMVGVEPAVEQHGRWRSVLVRRVVNPEEAELRLPPTDDQVIVLVTAGTTTIESCSNGRWQRVAEYGPGRIGMTAPGQPTHLRWRGDEPTRTTHVHLRGSLIDRTAVELWGRDADALGRPDALAVDDPVLAAVIGALPAAARTEVDEVYAEAAATFLAVHLLTRHAAAPPPREVGRENPRVRRAVRFIRDNHRQPLTLAEMAAVADLSPFHFLRVFKASTGQTPYRFLTRVRVESARRHLERGDLSITDIAHLCGFASSARLASAFRSETGTSPSAYRATHSQ